MKCRSEYLTEREYANLLEFRAAEEKHAQMLERQRLENEAYRDPHHSVSHADSRPVAQHGYCSHGTLGFCDDCRRSL